MPPEQEEKLENDKKKTKSTKKERKKANRQEKQTVVPPEQRWAQVGRLAASKSSNQKLPPVRPTSAPTSPGLAELILHRAYDES